MKVSELKIEMEGKFAAVDKQFEQVERRFERVDEDLMELRTVIRVGSEATARKFDEMLELIKSEGETTRRHFDVVAEKMESERNLGLDRSIATAQQVAGLTALNLADRVRLERRLDDHERRLENIERGQETDTQ